jgi:hypothetical protein
MLGRDATTAPACLYAHVGHFVDPMIEHLRTLGGLNRRGTQVLNETTYETLRTSSRRWHGDMTDIAEQR